ncbi:DUF433 domain-containing protein [Oerskovia flava]|uniref:DUF433 domain-containing protein n=1 Tax=Oerskovia flava TaxID=2986422 RepID=UPI00223F2C88|nr:DUF433 domain-containing protein [Oerskovia sp. JB1-3-2]
MAQDPRYDVPIYTIAEASTHLRLPPETLRRWVQRGDLITTLAPETPNAPRLPFVALAEAQFYNQLRRDGLTFNAITTGMAAVRRQLGDKMLRQGVLAHNGVDILMRLADDAAAAEWRRARDGQGGLEGVIERGLKPISWDADGLPARVRLTAYEGADVVVDPRFAFGKPILAERGVRAADIVDLFLAGDSVFDVAAEFGVDLATVESLVRTHGRAA